MGRVSDILSYFFSFCLVGFEMMSPVGFGGCVLIEDVDGGVEPADPDEIRCIENLEREKIIQFLQERHMSMNNSGRGKKV